ncbi:hypothetical protein Tco_1200377 [Tanacetum coccineum]
MIKYARRNKLIEMKTSFETLLEVMLKKEAKHGEYKPRRIMKEVIEKLIEKKLSADLRNEKFSTTQAHDNSGKREMKEFGNSVLLG